MTERKPPDVPFESWVDRQIRDAESRGEFENLPGAGRPMEAVDAPYDELWWIKGKMQGEGISILPPTLKLRKEAEDALPLALRARSEREARRIVTELNEKITAALRRPPPGPLLNLKPFDVDAVAAEWRAKHPDRVRPARQDPAASPERTRSRGRIWHRLRRGTA